MRRFERALKQREPGRALRMECASGEEETIAGETRLLHKYLEPDQLLHLPLQGERRGAQQASRQNLQAGEKCSFGGLITTGETGFPKARFSWGNGGHFPPMPSGVHPALAKPIPPRLNHQKRWLVLIR